jgi:Cft2 family RNA processing exonuclease
MRSTAIRACAALCTVVSSDARLPACPPLAGTLTAFFLSHFHSDHYGGLTRQFSKGTIFASPVTASLVIKTLGVNPALVTAIPMSKTVRETP